MRLALFGGMRRLLAAFGLFSSILTPALAHASDGDSQTEAWGEREKPQEPDRWAAPFTVWVHVPPIGPFGVLALSVDWSPVRWVAIEAGAGANFDGPQAAFWPRARVPLTRGFAISAGPSLAVGDYDADDDCFMCVDRQYEGPYRSWSPAVVGGALVAIEGRARTGFSWRVYAGGSRVLNESAVDCTPETGETECSARNVLAGGYLAASFGWADL